jgi:hypothetical protein
LISSLLDALTELLAEPEPAHAEDRARAERTACSHCRTVAVTVLALQLLDAVVDLLDGIDQEDDFAEAADAADELAMVDPAVGIVEACRAAFAELGDPEAMASEDLVHLLRQAPGYVAGRWRFANLTQARLAHLLAPYEVATRDVTLPDGRRRKSYRLSALIAADNWEAIGGASFSAR